MLPWKDAGALAPGMEALPPASEEVSFFWAHEDMKSQEPATNPANTPVMAFAVFGVFIDLLDVSIIPDYVLCLKLRPPRKRPRPENPGPGSRLNNHPAYAILSGLRCAAENSGIRALY